MRWNANSAPVPNSMVPGPICENDKIKTRPSRTERLGPQMRKRIYNQPHRTSRSNRQVQFHIQFQIWKQLNSNSNPNQTQIWIQIQPSQFQIQIQFKSKSKSNSKPKSKSKFNPKRINFQGIRESIIIGQENKFRYNQTISIPGQKNMRQPSVR